MRAHLPVLIDTDELATDITGLFEKPLKNVTAGELFDDIHAAHFNINTEVEERDEQRMRLAERLQMLGNGEGGEGSGKKKRWGLNMY